MTERIYEVSARFDGHEIEELQQYTAEELFEWGKAFANEDSWLLEKMEKASLEELYEELKLFENESYDDSLYRLWTVWNRFFDKYEDDATEEAEEAQEMFDRGMLEQYEWMLKNVIQQKEDEIEIGKAEGTFFMNEELVKAEEEGRIHQWQLDYHTFCQSLANSDTPNYQTKEGTDAFFEAAWETLVNFWRGKILDEFGDQVLDHEDLDPLGEGVELSILPDVLSGTPVLEAVHDWVDWKRQDLKEREEEDA
jgi:hypothetical protein